MSQMTNDSDKDTLPMVAIDVTRAQVRRGELQVRHRGFEYALNWAVRTAHTRSGIRWLDQAEYRLECSRQARR